MMEARLRPSLLLFLTSGTILLLLEHCKVTAIDFMQCHGRAPAGLLQDAYGSGSASHDNHCSKIIQQSAVKLVVEVLDTPSSDDIKVFPGQWFNVSIYAALNESGLMVSSIIAGSVVTSDGECSSTVTPQFGPTGTDFAVLKSGKPTTVPVRILGLENQKVSLVIYSAAVDTQQGGGAQACLRISLVSCGFGFKFNASSQTCICDSRIFRKKYSDVTCDSETHSIEVRDNALIGLYGNETVTVVDRCLLFGYCSIPGRQEIFIRGADFDVQCDNGTNRTGFLCSECRENYSAVLGTRNCKQCTNWYLFLFVFFIVIGIVAIVVIQYLNITITAGYINGAIFYSNIVSIFGYSIVPGKTYNEVLALTSFPSLDLGIETCLYDGMTVLQKVLWQLSFPVYLFILMFIITILARTKLLKFSQSAGSSTTRLFATLLILCYVSVFAACSELIAFYIIYLKEQPPEFILQWRSDPCISYFGQAHAVPGLIACVIMALYIFPLPIFLLFPKVLYRTKYSSKFKPIYDAFWDPYKPQYRFFLGLRLIFRWLPFFLVVTVRPPISLFVMQLSLILLLLIQCSVQPFREKWQNYVDAGFVCNLVLLFSVSVFFWFKFNNADSNGERDEVTQQSLIYSNILIIIGFLMILCIIGYHIYMRFPKLQEWIKARLLWMKSLKTKLCQPGNVDENVYVESLPDGDATKPTENGSLHMSELREPLLESGSIKLTASPLSLKFEQ